MVPHRRLVVAVEGGAPAAQPWIEAFARRLPDCEVVALGRHGDPDSVDYVASWKHPPGALAPFRRLKALFSLGAGVDFLFGDPALPAGVPIVRVVDRDLTERMSEWVVLQVLMQHRQVERYRRQQAESLWDDDPDQPAAAAVPVGVMGLGVLGLDAARKLKMMGFDVAGWSRTPKADIGLPTFHGAEGLDAFLRRTHILVVLLPLTPETRGIIDLGLLSRLARHPALGAPVLVNAGRGRLQVEADIVAALDRGLLRAAALDVFETEPLPVASPLWRHPAVIVTPHNAAISEPAAITAYIAEEIAALESGGAMRHIVDPARSY